MRPLKINLLGFNSAVLGSDVPVLVLFGAVWDFYSRQIQYQLERWGELLDGNVRMGFADIDYVPDLFSEYEVYEIPTMILFQNGTPYEPCVGYTDSKHVEKYLKQFFGGDLPSPKAE